MSLESEIADLIIERNELKEKLAALSKEKEELEADITRKDRKIEIQKAQLRFMGCPCDLTEFGNEHLHRNDECARLRDVLRHQMLRSHEYHPEGCSRCNDAKKALEAK